MKVNTLLIFYVPRSDKDTEVKIGASALFYRNRALQKAKSIRLIEYRLVTGEGPRPARKFVELDHAEDNTITYPGVGIYLIGHARAGGRATISNQSPKNIVDAIIKYCDAQNIIRSEIRKVALLACGGAAGIENSKVYKLAQEHAQAGLLINVCVAFASCGVTPMIAGWDDFVSICTPGGDTQGSNIVYATTNDGRKTITGINGNPVEKKDREHKKFVQAKLLNGDEVTVVAKVNNEWTDKV